KGRINQLIIRLDGRLQAILTGVLAGETLSRSDVLLLGSRINGMGLSVAEWDSLCRVLPEDACAMLPAVVEEDGDVMVAEESDEGGSGQEGATLFAERYLKVCNNTDQKMTVYVLYAKLVDGEESWLPGTDLDGEDVLTFELDPGEEAYLSDGEDNI